MMALRRYTMIWRKVDDRDDGGRAASSDQAVFNCGGTGIVSQEGAILDPTCPHPRLAVALLCPKPNL
jgi:hypothetical protein